MKPKVEAAIEFMEKSGKIAVIGSIMDIENAVYGNTGTVFSGTA